MSDGNIFEIRWHGRGGQGIVTAAKLLAYAAVLEGKYGVAQPFFGAERRGAPVIAFNRIANKKIWIKSMVYNPDLVVIVDKSLINIVNVLEGLKNNGIVIVNSRNSIKVETGQRTFFVDATGIAMKLNLKIAGIPLSNMPMLGAVSRVTNIVSLDALKMAIRREIKNMVEKNIIAVTEGWKNVIEAR